MAKLFDTSHFVRPLAEAAEWCATRKLPPIMEKEAMRDRRALLGELGNLMRQAYGQRRLAIFEIEPTNTRAWKKAEEIRRRIDSREMASPLRTDELRPAKLSESLDSPEDWKNGVAEVIKARAKLLKFLGRAHSQEPIGRVTDGRLLVYSPKDNLACGAAEFETMGFFDANNVPPWDTWVYYSSDYLVSWIPEKLVSLVQDGIDVNPEGCIWWADSFPEN
jgi:hypothetical protein